MKKTAAAVFLLVALVGCNSMVGPPLSEEGVTESVQAGLTLSEQAVEKFVQSQDLPQAQEVTSILYVESHGTVFFKVNYGEPQDCPAGCFYSVAYGLKYGEQIGWVEIAHYNDKPLNTDKLTFYNVSGKEGYLFTKELDERLKAADRWLYRYAFHPMLAGDVNTPRPVLLRLASGLYDYIQPSLGWTLLDNPNVRSDKEILGLLANLPVFQGDAYAGVRAQARELLDHL